MTTREATQDILLNGLFIPQGSVVYIDIHGIQRSPKYWQQPLQFMPERFLDKVGGRGCWGAGGGGCGWLL
jgi:cytochrome P450